MTYESSRVLEKALQQRIMDTAKALGWLAYHTHDARRSVPGFPDTCLVRGERLVFAELKSEKGKVTVEQQQWLDALEKVPGVECRVWRPADLQDAIEFLR